MDPSELERWLERFPPPPPAERERAAADPGRPGSEAPRKLPVERRLDLHGYTVEAARQRLDAFVRQALRDGVRKILVVHGKGSHAGSRGVLRDMVKDYFQRSPYVGTTGHPGAGEGGTGATWAIIRSQRSR